MQYSIVSGMAPYAVDAARMCASEVTMAISNGWKPLGGISICMSKSGNLATAVQALIKE